MRRIRFLALLLLAIRATRGAEAKPSHVRSAVTTSWAIRRRCSRRARHARRPVGDPSARRHLRKPQDAGRLDRAHWHPTDEHVTVLAGIFARGIGELDAAAWGCRPGLRGAARGDGISRSPRRRRSFQFLAWVPSPRHVNPADDPVRAPRWLSNGLSSAAPRVLSPRRPSRTDDDGAYRLRPWRSANESCTPREPGTSTAPWGMESDSASRRCSSFARVVTVTLP